MSEMLTTTELAERFPVANVNSAECWTRLLSKWQKRKLLKSGEHWRIRRTLGRSRPPREYDACRVLQLLWTSDSTFAESVRVEHQEAIRGAIRGVKEGIGV